MRDRSPHPPPPPARQRDGSGRPGTSDGTLTGAAGSVPAPGALHAASIELILTPRGHVILANEADAPALDAAIAARLTEAFSRGTGDGLLQLGAGEVATPLPPVFAFWRDFAARFVTAACAVPDTSPAPVAATPWPGIALPAEAVLLAVVLSAPPMTGGEYLTVKVLGDLWRAIDESFAARLAGAAREAVAMAESSGRRTTPDMAGGSGLQAPVQQVLRAFNPAWNTVGRVHFHLAENRKDPDAPFAFLATYTHGLSAHATPQHLPLGQALGEYAGAANKSRLLSLLIPVQRAAERCGWLKELVDRGEVYHPLRWSPREALALLGDVHALEQAGVVVRLPGAWKAGRPPRPTVTATVGTRPPGGLGLDSLLDFHVAVTVEGEPLTAAEIRALLDGVDGLALLRGRWVEVDGERLRAVINEFRRVERAAAAGGVTFAEAMRLMAGADLRPDGAAAGEAREWAGVEAGPWLAETLRALRAPDARAEADPGSAFHGTLRPYQLAGVRWLHLASSLGLGACLADDMGLGKTIQVLALLLALARQRDRRPEGARRPSLIVAPASLLANWAAETRRFAPSLSVMVAHPSAMPADELRAMDEARLGAVDLVVTTYGAVRTLPWIAETEWDLAVADEAQAIKNPGARQTRAVKALRARVRIAMTGTPIENRLGDLWSIFDFINPGLLGSAAQFTALTRRLAERSPNGYGPLRDLVRPYILRRLKTDRRVIADLPDKTEVNAYCLLSRRQAALYEQAVGELREHIATAGGMKRRGLVLASLMRLKQICNHPSHWLGDGGWRPDESGKWARLAEVTEVIAARQEKVLIFTQFREITVPLSAYLGGLFGRPGLVLHGGTPVKARRELVDRFQDDERVPFFVLSLKAGGTGLNLTAASHVVHFDRWWNPAVEDQATDRAFRIGQTRNVLVHKFVCRGTVEERIDELIASKRGLAKDLLEGGAELLLTEMKDEELLRLVALDANAALREG